MTVITKQSVAPIREPITLDEAKLHLRLDDWDYHTVIGSVAEDTLVQNLIVVAREMVESMCGPLISQTWIQYQDVWPDGEVLELWKPRIQSVTSITYKDEDETTTTFSGSYYEADTNDDRRGRIVLKPDYTWPTTTLYPLNPITITFVCGYGDDASDVPESIRQAMLILIAHWFEERQLVTTEMRPNINEVPWTVNVLLSNYRFWMHT